MTQTQSLSALIAKLAILITTLTNLVVGGGIGAAHVPTKFGLLQNTTYGGATTTSVGSVPYVQSVNAQDSSFNFQPSGLFYAVNGNSTSVTIGATSTNNGVNLWVTGTSTAFASAVIGPFGSASGTTSTVMSISLGIPTNGLSVGDPCYMSMAISSATTPLYTSCTVIATGANNATASISIANGSSSAFTLPSVPVFRFEIHHFAF